MSIVASTQQVKVNALNFTRAESDTYFRALVKDVGGVNAWRHDRQPVDVHHQTVIRMNRDTLYSFAIVDISEGGTLTMPQTGGRYQTAMIVNQDHYINRVFDQPGVYSLTMQDFETSWVTVAVRTLVDAGNPTDAQAVTALQDQLQIEARSSRPFECPDYDSESLKATRNLLLELAKGVDSSRGFFGSQEETGVIPHLLGTALGWGGLPEAQAYYLNRNPELPVGHYVLHVAEVPVRAFWSLSVYNQAGYFEPNEWGRYSINSVSAVGNPDGTVTVNLGGDPSLPNQIPVPEGWNYIVRFYQPEPEILSGTWTCPEVQPA